MLFCSMTRELYLQHVNDNIAISSKYACGFYNVATKVASFFFMVPQTQPQLAKQKYKKVQYSITFSLLCEYTPPPFEQNKYI